MPSLMGKVKCSRRKNYLTPMHAGNDRFRDAFIAEPEPREQTVHIARESFLDNKDDASGITVRFKA